MLFIWKKNQLGKRVEKTGCIDGIFWERNETIKNQTETKIKPFLFSPKHFSKSCYIKHFILWCINHLVISKRNDLKNAL